MKYYAIAIIPLILAYPVYSWLSPSESLEQKQMRLIEEQNQIITETNNTKLERYRIELIECMKSASGNVLQELDACEKRPKPVLQELVGITWTASGAIVPPPERQVKVSPDSESIDELLARIDMNKELTLKDRFGLWDCRFTNSTHELKRYNLKWIAYDFACVQWVSFDVKSPWEYTIEKIGFWYNIGNFIILKKSSEVGDEQTRIVLWHIKTSRKSWDKLWVWDIIWQTDMSWESTWMHVHIELWDGYMNVDRNFALGKAYKSQNGTALLNHRNWDFGQPKDNVYYFTHYTLWDPNQNDSSPCIGASWKDLCSLEVSGVRTMALTADIRKKLGVKFGDKVRLTGEKWCEGIYEVHDEMNKRFRNTPWILSPWTPYYIKGDIPSKSGGACHVQKL